MISDQFDESVHGDLVINSTTRLSESVMGVSFLHHFFILCIPCLLMNLYVSLQISLGYFVADLMMIFWHFPTLGGVEYVSIKASYIIFHKC